MGKKLYVLSDESESYKDGHREFHFECPGCNCMHGYTTSWSPKRAEESKKRGYGAPTWTFNNNLERPTFTPSLLYRYEKNGKPHVCHIFMTDGKIQYLGDCTHHLAGKTIEMKDLD